MTTRKLHEQGALIESKGTNGVFPIRIITEGVGSSGVYSRELLEKSKDVFANVPMFLDHPVDPEKPWERSVKSIASRTGKTVEYKIVDGVAGLYTEAKVRAEYVPFMEEYGDLIGVSIYVGGEGSEVDGKYVVESFDGSDSYRSVDWVVAAGRGGRIERAMESMRAIENSVGETDGKPSAEASAQEKDKEKKMEEEIKALRSMLETFIAESKATATEKVQAEADASAVESEVEARVAALESIDSAELLPSQVESLRAAVKGGVKDVAPLIESAKKIRDEAKADAIKVAESEGHIVDGGTRSVEHVAKLSIFGGDK